MGIFSKLISGGLMNEIRCDEPSYLIWKWRPAGGNGKRENAIRWGSSLRVKVGEVAAFVYKHNDGALIDFIEGPFDGVLETKNLPILADIIGLAYDGALHFKRKFTLSILHRSFRRDSLSRTLKWQTHDSRILVFQ